MSIALIYFLLAGFSEVLKSCKKIHISNPIIKTIYIYMLVFIYCIDELNTIISNKKKTRTTTTTIIIIIIDNVSY
jgi:hypothetical protein